MHQLISKDSPRQISHSKECQTASSICNRKHDRKICLWEPLTVCNSTPYSDWSQPSAIQNSCLLVYITGTHASISTRSSTTNSLALDSRKRSTLFTVWCIYLRRGITASPQRVNSGRYNKGHAGYCFRFKGLKITKPKVTGRDLFECLHKNLL